MDNWKFYRKFPNPPKFKSGSDKEDFEVPKYYGFDHPCTKWVLGSIVSNQALFRLLKVATNYQCILKRYHQIPDSPSLIMKDQYNAERAAFDSQAILYLTPLAISIYMKYEDALTQLVELRDAKGFSIINPNDLCYVQNFWRKGDTRFFTDLIATFPAIIAIRRNYFAAFRFLLMAGYCPNDSFTIKYRKPHREIIILYKDLIDYVIDYLRRRPAFNVGKLMNVLLHSTIGTVNNLDIFCFDYIPGTIPNLISIFQRLTRTQLDEDILSEENGMHIINILEKIQEAGFFLGLRNIGTQTGTTNLDELLKQKEDHKLKIADLQMLRADILDGLLQNDYHHSISNMIMWLQTKLLKRKTEQTGHLMKLLVKILFDTELIELFFKMNSPTNEDLLNKLSKLPNLAEVLEIKTVTTMINYVLLSYQQSETIITNFISRYKSEPTLLLLGYTDSEKKTKPAKVKKHDWVKSELADHTFRSKYLKCKEDSEKPNSNENKSNSYDPYQDRTRLRYRTRSSSFQLENKIVNSKFQTNTSQSEDYFYLSPKYPKFKSNSSNNCRKSENRKIIDDSIDDSIDLTIGSVRSLVVLDPNDTISISNIFDINNLTTIEIDLAEMKKSKMMCSEVLIAGSDEEGYRKMQLVPDIMTSSTCITNTSKISENLPPPLKEHKTRHYHIK